VIVAGLLLPPPRHTHDGRWSRVCTKHGYVKDSLISRLSVSKALGIGFSFDSVFAFVGLARGTV